MSGAKRQSGILTAVHNGARNAPTYDPAPPVKPHRATGIALYGGTILLAWWLIAAASGETYFNFVSGIFGSWIGLIVLFGYTFILVHHMLGGLRHFIWDFGYGLDRPARDRLALINIVGSVAITIVLWAIGLAVR
jgi:succinate dehydrogenase / fumarate reductase cytochrome b subunit